MRQRFFPFIFAAAVASTAGAAELRLRVEDGDGKPLADAVASLTPSKGRAPAVAANTVAIVDQRGLQFIPHVLPIQAGTRVEMPNSDQVRHHVYSFSPAKPFELRLYKDTPGDPGVFPTPGVVRLGCNIHDWMLGYIVVVDTPYFGKTDTDGKAALSRFPAGEYQLSVWHPRLGATPASTQVLAIGNDAAERTVVLAVDPPEPPAPPPSELEQKFRRYQAKPDER